MATQRAAQTYRMEGRSMFPLTAPLRARVQPTTELEVGDIAVFIGRAGQLVFHRVVAADATAYITRGDTLAHPDEPVPRAAVMGRVAWVGIAGVGLPIPARGLSARLARGLGVCWSRVAPQLRVAWRAVVDRRSR